MFYYSIILLLLLFWSFLILSFMCLSASLSVRLFICPMLDSNSRTDSHINFRFSRNVFLFYANNWRCYFEVNRSKVKVIRPQLVTLIIPCLMRVFDVVSVDMIYTFRTATVVAVMQWHWTYSGGATAVKEPGHFEARKSSSQVIRMHQFSLKKSWRPFLIVAVKTQAANAVSASK